jgi:hypothetical protein
MEKDGNPEEFVGPPSRNTFGGVVCGDGDVRGKFLCAWGEEELVVDAAKDAPGVGVDLYLNDL